MKKIPPGAEASNVLVGELEFLDRPVVAFVRLAPAVLLNGLAEVPITTRYYVLLRKKNNNPRNPQTPCFFVLQVSVHPARSAGQRTTVS